MCSFIIDLKILWVCLFVMTFSLSLWPGEDALILHENLFIFIKFPKNKASKPKILNWGLMHYHNWCLKGWKVNFTPLSGKWYLLTTNKLVIEQVTFFIPIIAEVWLEAKFLNIWNILHNMYFRIPKYSLINSATGICDFLQNKEKHFWTCLRSQSEIEIESGNLTLIKVQRISKIYLSITHCI